MPRLTDDQRKAVDAFGGPEAPADSPTSRKTAPEAAAVVLGATKQQVAEHFEAHVLPLLALDAGLALFPADDPTSPTCLGTAKSHHADDYDPADCDGERGKHAVGYWPTAATRSPKRARQLFCGPDETGQRHLYNIGINWAKSGDGRYVTLDEDTAGELRRWCTDRGHPALPATLGWNTGKGHQWVYRLPEGVSVGNRSPFKDAGYDIDVRGSGKWSYSIGPGSTHRTGVLYELAGRVREVADAPDWLVALLTTAERTTRVGRAAPAGNRGAELAALLASPPAQGGRNDWLTKVSGHLARQHRGDRDGYDAAVAEANARLTEPLPDAEVARTAESVWATDQANHPGAPAVTDEDDQRLLLDDSRLVDSLAEQFRPRWRWSRGDGWREWSGKVWADRSDESLTEAVRLVMQDLYEIEVGNLPPADSEQQAKDNAARMRALAALLNGGKVRGVAGLLRGPLEEDPAAFDAHPELLNVGNGVVDLRTGELRPHDPDLLLTRITETGYRPGATHPDWEKTLEAVPEASRAWLQVRLGQAATGYRVTDELMPVLYGGGRNGKTTFLSSCQSALGGHARTISDRVLTARDSDHPTELTDLQGLRLAVMEELPEAQPLSVKRLKDVVGQPTITARKIRRDTVTWETTHALVLATNHKPRVAETDHGTWRRLALVRFPYTFDGGEGEGHRPADPGLHERMRRDRGGKRSEAVLSWLVAGAVAWFAADEVFPKLPEQVVADTLDWRGDSDAILAYATERLVFSPGLAVRGSDLLADLNEWLRARGKPEWGDTLASERFGNHETVVAHGTEKRYGRLGRTTLVGRNGGTLPNPGEKVRAWFGVGFAGRAPEASDDDEGGLF